MTIQLTTRMARITGLLALGCVLLLSACDTSTIVESTDDVSTTSRDQPAVISDVPIETVAAVTSPKTLIRALDDRVYIKARARAAAATPDEIRALVLARQAAEAVMAQDGNVEQEVLDAMTRQANAALEPFINQDDAAYLSAVARRLDELGVSTTDVPVLTKSLEHEGALSKTDPCDRACAVAYANDVTQIELAYLGAVLACTLTGPGVLLCFGGATAVKTATLITSTLEYTTCVKACREQS